MSAIPKEIIRDRLKFAQLTLGDTVADFFASNVSESKKRNIVLMTIAGDGANAAVVTIQKKVEAGTYSDAIIVYNAAAGFLQVPPGSFDIESPVLVLEGGTNIGALCSAGAHEMTIVYWDE
ncbi:MAG: hypothetical protein PHZ19_07650 [Candidatus Thermoplasmatota archaeon]|jgi:hypothetical protein|nr:hypothetical protein [Candidatus Thermoplasmatota archaeon]